jgi:hypothetical protein
VFFIYKLPANKLWEIEMIFAGRAGNLMKTTKRSFCGSFRAIMPFNGGGEMLGAVIGDIVGSVYEGRLIKTTERVLILKIREVKTMFCPRCGDEFVEGITECVDCKVPLVRELPPRPEPEYIELVTVLEVTDPSALMFAKSILEGAGIRYFAKGERLQNLFGGGRLGLGFNLVVGPVRLQVACEDEKAARILLTDFQ